MLDPEVWESKVIPLILGLFLILMAMSSTTKTNRSGETQQPCFTPLSVLNQEDNQPPFFIQLSVSVIKVFTILIKLSPS